MKSLACSGEIEMGIQTIQLSTEVPDGFEVTGEFRPADSGDAWLAYRGAVCHGRSNFAVPILRRTWTWPEWVKPGTWIAMDATGDWWFYDHEPECFTATWSSGAGRGLSVNEDFRHFMDFTPPPCTDWRTSKRQKP